MKIVTLLILIALGSVTDIFASSNSPCKEGPLLLAGQKISDCLKFAEIEASEGPDKGIALKLTPDPWHNPKLKIYCGKNPRWDFSNFTDLEFHFRCPALNPGNPTIQLKTWDKVSSVISIRDYIEGGTIDNTYRRVSIPLSRFRTSEWDLGNVESIEWNVDPDRRTYFVYGMRLNQTSRPSVIDEGQLGPFFESNRVIRLTFSTRWQEDSVRDVKNYTISSHDDPDYNQPVHPSDIGLLFRVYRFSPSKAPYTRYSVYARLPVPVKNECSYNLKVQGIKDEFCNVMNPSDIALKYDDRIHVNPVIKVNQEGYLPDSPKTGYLGGYLGDLGGAAWAVGKQGAVFHWTLERGWEKIPSPTKKNLRSVSGIREDDVYCVGDGGKIIHWDGKNLGEVDSPTTQDLHSVVFGPQGTGWAVGANGVILRKLDGSWQNIPSGVTENLHGVWPGPGDGAWAVGDKGLILKWDGTKWLKENLVTGQNIFAIGGGGDSAHLWAVGDQGTILTRSHGKWKVVSAGSITKENLRCVDVDPGGAVWMGGHNGGMWRKDASSSEIRSVKSNTNKSIYGLTRQNSRRLWATGSEGLLLACFSGSETWDSQPDLGSEDLLGLFSIPFGALRLPRPTPEVIIRNISTGEIALKTGLKLEAANWHLSGEDVYSFDFSRIKDSGLYEAYVPGIGVSSPIRISEGALNKAAYTTAHAFYYQRCGTPLIEPFAEKVFTRPLDHEYDTNGRKIDAAFYESLQKSPLYGGEKPGDMIDAHGGWHDAGDYGKYLPTAAAALWYLFTAYDIEPSKFQDGTWNIPESGNGIPDLLDETKWELDWISRIQAADGGVYHKQTSEGWFHGMPQDENSQRYLFDKTTHDTASAAAVFASGARIWRKYDRKISEDYLNRAEKAWSFLESHPDETPKGGFQNPPKNTTGDYRDKDDTDNRLWAAAELFRTTGKEKYRNYFESWWRKNKSHPWGWNNWQDFYRGAYWAYYHSGSPDANQEIRKDIKKGLLEKARRVMEFTSLNPYRNGARLDVPQWIGWGAFTQSSEYSFLLLQAWSITQDKRYYHMALVNLDTQLGANPLSMCFVTGLGYRSPKDPLHLPSMYDQVDRPVPGLPIFGPVAHLPNNQPYYVASQQDATSYPQSRDTLDPYPILRRYIDANQLVGMSEFTIVDMAACSATLNLLAQKPERNGN